MFNFYLRIKKYVPLLPLLRKRLHFFIFRFLLAFISILLLNMLLIADININRFIQVVEISNPVEVLFESQGDFDSINQAVKKIEGLKGVLYVDLLTSDTVKNSLLSNETVLQEAESIGINPYKNIGHITLCGVIGNLETREKIIHEIKSVNGVREIIYNKSKYLKLDYYIKFAKNITYILYGICIVFIIATTIFSSLSTLNLTHQEMEYIETVKIIIPDIDIMKAFIAEGIITTLSAFFLSSIILCLIWLMLKWILKYKIIFLPLGSIFTALFVIIIFFVAVNIFVFKKHRDAIDIQTMENID